MSAPGVEIYSSPQELFRAAAERIVAVLEAATDRPVPAAFVLTGGNTPKPVYELLSAPPYRDRLQWSHIHIFWGDERCVPPDSPQSNYGMARAALLSGIPIPSQNVHRVLGELDDPDEAATRYEAEIRRVFPDTSLPAFNLVLLGMGEDGHTASLFPGTSWDESRWVVSNYVPKLKAHRVTMTPLLLNAAQAVIFLTSGSTKAKALAGVLEDPASEYPAKKIMPVQGILSWMVDEAAAALLKRSRKTSPQ